MDSQSADDTTQDVTPIVNGEVTEATEVNQGTILVDMEGMIKNYIAANDRLQQEAKKLKEMLDDIFNNDPVFAEHDKVAKDAAQLKAKTRAEILKRPQAKELNEKIKEMKNEIKENQGALSDYLQEYQRLSGVNEIEADDGTIYEIKGTMKPVKKGFVQ